MRRADLSILTALLGVGLSVPGALALRNPALTPRAELPRDQFLNLVDPVKVNVKHLKVKFSEETRVRLRDGELVSLEGQDLAPVRAWLACHPGMQLLRPWSLSEEEVDAYTARGESLSGQDLADLNNWYTLLVPEGNPQPKKLLQELLTLKLVETCHYQPWPQEAACGPDVAPATPSFTGLQDYRDPAPLGIGIDYAWQFNPTAGNGIMGYHVQDVEFGWCQGHEDMDDEFVVYDSESTTGDHGLSVVSILGACDNGFGMTGLVPDVELSGQSWATTDLPPDFSNAFLNTGAFLEPGETYLIEIHFPGPSQGTVCPCNCPQFEYIAVEYWTDNFDVIATNSANGRVCIEAGGNGSMDLDWAGYSGAFNRSVRDSGAILVGAADASLPHNAACFSSHGSRIDFYGWGDSVAALGYGHLHDVDGCVQDYTQLFSGTSSATPIVAGAAVSLASIHRQLTGAFPTPALLRQRLAVNGTPQGPVDPHKEIGVMPNLKGVLAPDLEPVTPAGWHGPLVPSNSSAGSLPLQLEPAPASNWLRLNWSNTSLYGAAPANQVKHWRDDALVGLFSTTATGAGQFGSRDISTLGIRGGRHYLRMELNPDGVLDEANTSDNSHVEDFCWNPVALVDDVPSSQLRGPKKDPLGYAELALDGYGNGGDYAGYWEVFSVLPSVGADYDLQLFDVAPTATSGWTDPVTLSDQALYTDFVGCNNNTGANGDWVGVVNHNNSNEGYTVEGDGSTYVGTPPAVNSVMASGSLDSGEILDILEFRVTSLTPIYFLLEVTGGSAHPALFVYPASSTYFNRAGAALSLEPSGSATDLSGVFTPVTAGYHALVICKSLRDELSLSATYTLQWGPAPGDLTHTTPAGWSGPLVPRVAGGTVGQVPTMLLPGNTVLDMGYTNLGPGAISTGFNQRFTVDGLTVETSPDLSGLAVGASAQRTAVSPGTLKGGRHEIGSILDCNQERSEAPPAGESNNRVYVQLAWSANSLVANTPQSQSSAPNFQNRDNPDFQSLPGANQDGYRFTVNGWTGVAALPAVANTGTCVYGYTYYSSHVSTSFLNPAATSTSPEGALCLVMYNGHYSGENQGRNVGVANSQPWPVQPPSGTYTIQAAPSQGLIQELVPLSGTLAGGTSTGGQILQVYEMDLSTRERCSLSLDNQSSERLGLAVFPPGAACLDSDDALLTSNPAQAGVDAGGSFTAPVAGRYGVAVYRCKWDDLGPAASFTIMRGQRQPAQPLIAEFRPVDFENGHAIMHLEITPVTVDVEGDPLVVDTYKLYVDDDPWLSSPQVASTTLTSMDLSFHNIGMPTRAFLRVTAVDENGRVLADSRPDLPLPVEAAAAPQGWLVPRTGLRTGKAEQR